MENVFWGPERERTGERQREGGTEERSSGKRDTFICKGNFDLRVERKLNLAQAEGTVVL